MTDDLLRKAAENARAHARLPIEVSVDIVSENNFYAGLSLNISEGGLFVATHQPYEVGTRLEIRLFLPGDEQPTMLLTEVRWVREAGEDLSVPAGLGLRFLALAPEVAARLQSFAETRDPLYYDDEE